MGSFKLEVIDKITALMTAAFGLVAALAWNETIKALMYEVFGEAESGLMGYLIYAIIVTIVAVAAIILIARTYNKVKSKEEAKAAAKNKKE